MSVSGGGSGRCGGGGRGAGEGSFFDGEVGVQVDLGRLDAFVAEPERDDGDVDAGVSKPWRTCDAGRAGSRSCCAVTGSVGRRSACLATAATASRLRGPRGRWGTADRRVAARSASQTRSTATVPAGQRGDPLFSAFAVAAEVGAGAELDVGAGEGGELGDAQAGLDGERSSAWSRRPIQVAGRGRPATRRSRVG